MNWEGRGVGEDAFSSSSMKNHVSLSLHILTDLYIATKSFVLCLANKTPLGESCLVSANNKTLPRGPALPRSLPPHHPPAPASNSPSCSTHHALSLYDLPLPLDNEKILPKNFH